MRAGSLKHRLTIQVKSTTGDGMGGSADTWTDERTVWGAVWPLRGQELMIARQQQSEITHQIRIRYVPGITAHKHRLRHGDPDSTSAVYYDIVSPPIDNELRHRELTFYVRQQA